MLQKFLDAGGYTVAGNVIFPDPTRGQVIVAFWLNGGWKATPVGEQILTELAHSQPEKPKPAKKQKPAERAEVTPADDLADLLDN